MSKYSIASLTRRVPSSAPISFQTLLKTIMLPGLPARFAFAKYFKSSGGSCSESFPWRPWSVPSMLSAFRASLLMWPGELAPLIRSHRPLNHGEAE